MDESNLDIDKHSIKEKNWCCVVFLREFISLTLGGAHRDTISGEIRINIVKFPEVSEKRSITVANKTIRG